ncbi:QWRF motif-containing protein 2-like [Carex rostrata]
MVVAATTPKLAKTTTRHPSPSPILSSSDNSASKTRSNSTLRNSTSTSSSTRFSSPLPVRSLSATRTRPANTTASTTSSTTTRSLSVSFQGESFVYQTTKCKDSTPPARKPSPKRQQSIQTPNVAPGSAPGRPATHLPWPSAKMHLSNPIPLTKSLDCSLTKRGPALASAIKSLRRSMMFSDEVVRRNSFDSTEYFLSSDTDSTSSGSLETSIAPRMCFPPPRGGTIPEISNTRVKRVVEPNNPVRKPTMTASPLNGLNRFRGSSPVRRTPSPSRVKNGLSNAKVVSTHVEGRRRKKTESRLEEEHLLRVSYSRHLQWCCINAQADVVHAVQKTTAERCLYDTWIAISEKLDSVMLRRLKVHLLKYNLKLMTIFKGQMRYLEELSVVDRDYFSSLSGLIDALKATTLSLPVTDGAKANTLAVKNSIGSAVDAMQSVSRSICMMLSKVQETKLLVSELADVVVRERDFMQQCRELLSIIAALQVKYCSMEGQRLQLTHLKESAM